MKKIMAILLLILLLATVSHAGSAGQGTLSYIHFMDNGVVLAYTSGARYDAPLCASYQNRFAINATTTGGKVQLAGLLSAYATGKQVVIYGDGSCSIFSDTETISFFYIVD